MRLAYLGLLMLAGCISLDAGDTIVQQAPDTELPQPGQLGGTLLATLDVGPSSFSVLSVTGTPPHTIAINGAVQPLVLGQAINPPQGGGAYQVRIEDSEGAFFATVVELSQ